MYLTLKLPSNSKWQWMSCQHLGILGNAYRKQGNWQLALNNYQYAIDLNPDSPAREAYRMAMDILNFFNKDMYNQ